MPIFVTPEVIAPWTRTAARADIALLRGTSASIPQIPMTRQRALAIPIPITATPPLTSALTIRTALSPTLGWRTFQWLHLALTTCRTPAGSAPSTNAMAYDKSGSAVASESSANADRTAPSIPRRIAAAGRHLRISQCGVPGTLESLVWRLGHRPVARVTKASPKQKRREPKYREQTEQRNAPYPIGQPLRPGHFPGHWQPARKTRKILPIFH